MMRLRRPRLDARGVSTIEFALVAPILLLIIVAVMNFGNALQESNRLEDAARAGMQFSVFSTNDRPGICRAVCRSLPAAWRNSSTTVRVTYRCGTTTSSGVCTLAANCDAATGPAYEPSTACTSQFTVSVELDRPFSPLALVPYPTSVSGNAIFRTR